MQTPWTLIAAFLGLAGLYVLLPVGFETFRRLRKRRTLRCPETGQEAEVELNALRAALGSALGQRRMLRMRECSLWPERKDCPQTCLRALAEEGLPVRSLPGRG